MVSPHDLYYGSAFSWGQLVRTSRRFCCCALNHIVASVNTLRHLLNPMIPFSCCPSWMDSVLAQNRVVCLNTCPRLGRSRCVAKCFCNPPWPGPTRVSLARVLKALFWSSALEGRGCPGVPGCPECIWGSFWFTTDNLVKNILRILATSVVERAKLVVV